MNLVSLIRNDKKIYEGDLIHYFRTIITHAKNLKNPYHNFRHLFHVLWLCHEACVWYIEKDPRQYGVGKKSRRNLLIAAMFHDFDHSGQCGTGRDHEEIARAIDGFRKHIALEDKHSLPQIEELITATEFPYTIESNRLSLSAKIIRDADMGQTFDPVWIQQIIFGLAQEMGIQPKVQLLRQQKFMSSVVFHSEWGQTRFPQPLIQARIQEVKDLISFL